MRIAIVSASSDIGNAIARHGVARGWSIAGTYRTRTTHVTDLEGRGVSLVQCDLDDPSSVTTACQQLASLISPWDALILCPATLEPVGDFEQTDFDSWSRSVHRNFIEQMRSLHMLLPSRSRAAGLGPCVITWAGGGTNTAPRSYSAYTVSKLAQIKMMELLDAELPDVRFVIVGPGWVRTKIHDETLRAGHQAGANYDATKKKMDSDEGWTDISEVIACCEWILGSDRAVVGGRNFSVAHDEWGDSSLEAALRDRPEMYKLRRAGNDWEPSI